MIITKTSGSKKRGIKGVTLAIKTNSGEVVWSTVVKNFRQSPREYIKANYPSEFKAACRRCYYVDGTLKNPQIKPKPVFTWSMLDNT